MSGERLSAEKGEVGIDPDFGDPDPCWWCGDDARGRSLCDDGIWRPSCHDPDCRDRDDAPYRGAA